MHQWLVFVFRWWWHQSWLCTYLGSVSTICSSHVVSTGRTYPPPPACLQTPLWLPKSTTHHIPTCCNNKPGRWYWSQPESLGQIRRSIPTGWPAQAQIPGRPGCQRSRGIVHGGATDGSAVAVAPCESDPRYGWLVGWDKWASWLST